jgi:hypothetical protein
VNYRKECLDLVEQMLRENFEQRFLATNLIDKNAVEDTENAPVAWMTKRQNLLYTQFLKEQVINISREVYTEKINEVMAKIMVDMASISKVFSDEEMHQIYDLTKSPLGMKVIRNLDIMRDAVRDGLFLMGREMRNRFRSPEYTKQLEDFFEKLKRGKK